MATHITRNKRQRNKQKKQKYQRDGHRKGKHQRDKLLGDYRTVNDTGEPWSHGHHDTVKLRRSNKQITFVVLFEIVHE